MMYRVSLVSCCDGHEPDEVWQEGIVIEDRRDGAFDLIAATCERLGGSRAIPGEVWKVEPLREHTLYRVKDDGTLEPL